MSDECQYSSVCIVKLPLGRVVAGQNPWSGSAANAGEWTRAETRSLGPKTGRAYGTTLAVTATSEAELNQAKTSFRSAMRRF
jgi:hypothetical protein